MLRLSLTPAAVLTGRPRGSGGEAERRMRAVQEVVPHLAQPVGDRLAQGVGARVAPEAVESVPGERGLPVRTAAGVRDNLSMRISARADYAVRAALELAAAGDDTSLKAEAIADAQGIPHKFLEGILGDLRRGGLVVSQRGGKGGYRLARPAESIAIAEVIRVADGPLVSVRGVRPPDLSYIGPAESLLPLWIAVRANVRKILGEVTLAHVAAAKLPDDVLSLADDPEAWTNP